MSHTAPGARPDALSLLTRFLEARPAREAELMEASARSLDRAREADRRWAGARLALTEIEEIARRALRAGGNPDWRLVLGLAAADDDRPGAPAIELAGTILVTACHAASTDRGWWRDPATGESLLGQPWSPYVVGTKLMLMVSEIAEAMEGDRKGLMDDKLPHRSALEVELADAVIRIADLAGAKGLDLGGAIADKMAFNATRPDHDPSARAAAGGKAY